VSTRLTTSSKNEPQKQIITSVLYDNHIAELASRYDLVLLDLDDVTLTPVQFACGVVWHNMHRAANQGKLAAAQLIDDVYDCFNRTQMMPVSQELISDFSALAHFLGVHFTSVRARLACDYSDPELDALGRYQHRMLIEEGVLPSNAEFAEQFDYCSISASAN
jgi:hypothetical protein